jgi:hypothetical protein
MRIGIAAATAALWLSACGGPAAEPPVLIEPSQVKPLLQFSDELDGKRVSVDGYIQVGNGFASQGASTYTLTSRPRGLGDDLIQFSATRGAEANQMDTPALNRPGAFGGIELIDPKKAGYRDGSGDVHSVQDKVRVTGVLDSGAADADGRSPTGQRFRPRLRNVTFEVAP